jgi:hypothetical protein
VGGYNQEWLVWIAHINTYARVNMFFLLKNLRMILCLQIMNDCTQLYISISTRQDVIHESSLLAQFLHAPWIVKEFLFETSELLVDSSMKNRNGWGTGI